MYNLEKDITVEPVVWPLGICDWNLCHQFNILLSKTTCHLWLKSLGLKGDHETQVPLYILTLYTYFYTVVTISFLGPWHFLIKYKIVLWISIIWNTCRINLITWYASIIDLVLNVKCLWKIHHIYILFINCTTPAVNSPSKINWVSMQYLISCTTTAV